MNYSNQNQLNNNGVVLQKLNFYVKRIAVMSFMIMTLFSLTNCSSNDDSVSIEETVLPTLILTTGSVDVFNGVIGSPTSGTLNYSVLADTPSGFKEIVINKITDGNTTHHETIDINHPDFINDAVSFTYTLNYILTDGDSDREISFQAIAKDSEDNTVTIDFASALVKKPLVKEHITMKIEMPFGSNPDTPSFLYENDAILKSETIAGIANDSNLDQHIFAILSFNDELGLYLASPFATVEDDLTGFLSEINQTKFKMQSFGAGQFTSYTIYDVYEIESLYDAVNFNTDEQRTENFATGRIYSFLTEDSKEGLILVNSVENMDGDYEVEMDIFLAK
jgi:hypothetical protein